jgi:uncharacterized RDD family membrane protein YckC
MNLESLPSKKENESTHEDFLMEDFDFKPITSGLGFHHSKPADVKPVFTERTNQVAAQNSTISTPVAKKEMSVYQNDLSIFYNQSQSTTLQAPSPIQKDEKAESTYRLAGKSPRILAYLADLLFICSLLGVVLTVMARTISMDLMEVWTAFPNEITPLVLTLFIGFYVMYFAIFEKSPGSTIGKNIFKLKVVTTDTEESLTFSSLVMRAFVTLLNFISLGLFAYFDLQNKITHSKVMKVK